ncbi:putative lipoprotein [Plesiocystis pacifica SIR-1]|uniref:Putative lipoprotein n=1 Tax=Plesiocystis pacifica SIR-1 TaxID=391625 RepID=A6GFT9_9BACT|nr:MbnP family copper-binding protein [Plesiocystis pacifica]EDM75286.1 putative lipoprotein [Plesiocystis pacifica SIR-1]
MSSFSRILPITLILLPNLVTSCLSPSEEEHAAEDFSLRFAASVDGQPLACGEVLTGFGPEGASTVAPADLRFYVSDLQFWDADGEPIERALDRNDFQYASEAGEVALIDLTGGEDGACAGGAIGFAEGTSRTNAVITGQTALDRVARVSFDVGVPQALMREVILGGTAEAAPSPLNEMYWSWASGYRHLVFNFAVETGADASGEGYVHIGSRDCSVEGGLALEDQEACGFINTPRVELDFDLRADTVTLDVGALLGQLDFVSPVRDPETHEVIGEGPGVECHSSPMQADCAQLFANLGLDPASGEASAATNLAFTAEP